MLLLFIWVVIVLATPKVSMIVAGKLHDVPSAQEVQSKKDAAMTQIMTDGQKKMREYFRENQSDNSPEARAKRMEKVAEMQKEMFSEIGRKKGKIDVDYEAKKAAQFQLATRISRISPASVYTYASTNLAGTGFDRQQNFTVAARAYQVGFMQYFGEVMGKMMRNQEGADEIKFELDKLPALDFREASLADSWNSAMVDFLILFLLFACFFMIAYVGFIRSDIR